jgi:hypothetical protein
MEITKFNFIHDAYSHQKEQRTIYDNKASFLIGISGVIFALSMNQINKISFLIIAVAAFAALILSVWTVSFPFPHSKKAKFSLLCWSGFQGMKKDEYEAKMKEIVNSDEKIIHEYIKEVYALYQYSVLPKSRMIRMASLILTISLFTGLLLLILGV